MSPINCNLVSAEDELVLVKAFSAIEEWLGDGRALLGGSGNLKAATSAGVSAAGPLLADLAAKKINAFSATVETSQGKRLLLFHYPQHKYLPAPSPAALGHQLYLAALRTPVLLLKSYGYLEEQLNNKIIRAAQVLESLPAYQTLAAALDAARQVDNSPKNRALIFQGLARQLAILHNAGFYSPALRPDNMLLLPDTELNSLASLSSCRLLVLDSSRAAFMAHLDSPHRAVNLYQFYRYLLNDASENERFHFIEDYCNYLPAETLDPEDLYRRVTKHYREVLQN